jgi:riboflavin biosynthesis pyrimidine reductase
MGRPDYTAIEFPPAPPDRPYAVLNMVMSVDGKVAIDGIEKGLGSAVDHRLMRELRVHADVILNGAETLRRTGASPRLGYADLDALRAGRGARPLPLAATLSRSGDLPFERIFFTARDFDAVVYLSESCTPERRAAVEAAGRPVVMLPAGREIPAMLRHMRHDLDASLLVLETGPTLNAELFALDAIDEFFVTVGPLIVGGAASLTPVGGDGAFSLETARRLHLISAVPNEETGEVYLRYRVRR